MKWSVALRKGCAGVVAWGCVLALAAPLVPNQGALTVSGRVADGGRDLGRFEVQAVLRDGNFSGTGTLELGGATVAGPLLVQRSYLENGKCHFRFESGRARVDLGGQCNSAALEGRFETFIPGDGLRTGSARGKIVLVTAATPAAASGRLPDGKLVCAFSEPKISFQWGEAAQYSLLFSAIGSLTLNPAGSYSAGRQTGGRFVRVGPDKIRLTSGTWAGALGTLENDRSGMPAVVFHREENRRPDGVHLIDPYTTRCTKPR